MTEGQRTGALVARLQIKTLSYELPYFLNAPCGPPCVSQKVVDGNSRVRIAAFLSEPNLPAQCRQPFATMSSEGEFLPELCFCMKVHVFPLVLPGKKSVFNPWENFHTDGGMGAPRASPWQPNK